MSTPAVESVEPVDPAEPDAGPAAEAVTARPGTGAGRDPLEFFETLVRRPETALGVMVGVYVWVFGNLTWSQQSNFGTFGFDMGIYDQGIWLLSRLRLNPFDTVRGLPLFAHHVNLILWLFVPAYWLGAGPHFLYLVETLALAVGAIPLWLLARDRLGNGWLALCPAAAYLLYPSLEFINWWHFHPDALIIAPLLWAYWLADRERWGWFALAVTVALLCKEDASLAVVGLGLVVAFRQRRVRALLTSAAGLAWFFIATKLIIPTANGGGQVFYESFFPGFGHSLFGVVGTIVRHPTRLTRLAFRKDRITYYTQLFVPVALLPVGALPVLLIGLPQLLVNVISSLPYTRSIMYYYSSIPLAAIFIATVESLGRGRTEPVRRFACGALVATALASNVAWSPSPISVKYHSGIWALPNGHDTAKNEAVALVPQGASVSATYYLVPHLTHRTLIYEFPNPWVVSNWGVNGERPPDPSKVDWLVVDTGLNGTQQGLYEHLTSYQFAIVSAQDGIVVAHRVHPA